MRKIADSVRRLRRCDNGAAAVEFAMIGMVMIVLSIGTIELGRGLYLYNRITHAADRAARKALTKPDATDQVLRNEILSSFAGEPIPPDIVVTTPAVASEVAYRVIELTMSFTPLVPGFVGPINMTIVRRIPMLS